MSTVPSVELGVLGPLQVRQDGATVTIPGAKPRAILTMLGLHNGSVVSADTLIALLWGDDPPRTAAKALQTHISSLRRALGDGVVVTEGTGWTLHGPQVDATRYKSAAKMGRDAAAGGDTSQAVARFEEALALWRGIPELPEGRRGTSEKTRWIEGYAALVEDRADALLATGRAAELIGELEGAVADAPLRERRWGQLMLALYRAGRQGEALGAFQRARALLAEELGVDPGPDLRRLEAAIVTQDSALETPAVQHVSAVTRAVTFLLTDIEGSTAAWEADADAMAVALARHDELVEQVVTSRGGRLIKTRGEGDATFSVFERPSAAAAAAIELQEAITGEPWALREPMRIRVALHTGEVEFRDGDYFGRAVNRAARLRSLAAGGQILCSGATAELVIDSLPDDVVLADLGTRELRNLARPERVFELRLDTADDVPQPASTDAPLVRPMLPAVLAGPGPFVGRGRELAQLFSAWQIALSGATNAMLIAGEPGVGKTRLAGEWSRQAYDQGALVIYGRCDEDLGAPYQPFAEALRSLVPCLGASKLRGLRGVEALLTLVPGLTDVLPDLPAPTRADPDTERYALFDAVVAVLGVASTSAPVVLILDDLHWAAKPTLLLLRHLLRFGEQARVQILGTYRSTDLDRSHPLAAMLADLHRDGTANRVQLGGLDENDVTTYVAEAGYHDEELARALASVTGGNPFFLIEALRHVDESGGQWDPSTLPQGVREAVSRRLSRLPAETNKALAAAAVVGSRFALELVEHVVGDDLVDAFDEACKAGIVIEEPGGRYRFNHALVRQSLLAELPSVRRMRLHQRIAATLEDQPGADDELLAELAHHYFECAWAGNAAKAVEYCRRAADQAMARLAYEGAADLYDRALHALEEIDDELPDRDEQIAVLLVARCEALLAAGDVASAAGAVSQLQEATRDSVRLAAWAACFDGELSMLIHPDRLDEVEAAVGAAAEKLAELDDTAGEAKAHTVRAGCLARLGRIGDCEIALDDALTAARRAREHRRVNAVLANAPLAALWGPNPVPRAGGRCLDVVRLLRITTDSPAVEATSTRCQAVLEAFRGRAAAARRMIDSARRTVTELGLRHALLEVEQFAGIVELVVDDPAAAEPHLRQAYNGFRRMGLDADTAETAALLGRTCLTLDREDEADELCTESERLAGHALKASIAWRILRAQLLSRGDAHDEARLVAEAAVSRAERTDALVDHGDACLALATVLDAAGDARGARAAAAQAVSLYERKGAAALAEKAQRILGERELGPAPTSPEAPSVKPDNACVQAIRQLDAAVDREAWPEYEALYATDVIVESRRKMVGVDIATDKWPSAARRLVESGTMHRHVVLAVRGERLALFRVAVGTEDVSPGAPKDEVLGLYGLDEEGRIRLAVWFDIEGIDAATAELDAAHARFEQERPRAPLENAASRADDRFNALFADRRWDEIGALLTDNIRVEDRRRGLRREGNDRATELAELRAIADLGVKSMTSDVLAIRGERLALSRVRYSGRDKRPEAFHTELLRIAEIDAEERIVAYVALDSDDFDAAIAELDARYLAGEAAPYANTWSAVAGAYAAFNRHEIPATPDWVNVDHRRATTVAPGDMAANIRATWDIAPNIRRSIEAVHRLDNLGAVVTHTASGTSHEGFDAEWRVVTLLTFTDDLISRAELFDEEDIDAALAKFDQLSSPTRRLENAATQVAERFVSHHAASDWGALAEMLAENFCSDDRRRVVGAGVRHGQHAQIMDLQAMTDLSITKITSTPVATRGERLVLVRGHLTDRHQGLEAFLREVLAVVEINSDERIVGLVAFDLDDFEAAIAELDARYLAGEAAANSRTWSVIATGYAELNRQKFPATAPDFEDIDHRRAAPFAPGDLFEYLRAAWDLGVDVKICIDTVHQLSDFGAVVTHMAHGTSHEGSDFEWHEVNLLTVEGDKFTRCELFDETDIDAALARFEQLRPSMHRLENAASRVNDRFLACFADRDWDAMADALADDQFNEDRRRVVNAGIHRGWDAELENFRWAADVGCTHATLNTLATRGERLALACARFLSDAFHVDLLQIVEIDTDERIAAFITFDLDDFEAAIAELDARYLAGEAAAHAHTWSAVGDALAAINRHELPKLMPDWVNIDHRRGAAFATGDMTAYLHDLLDDTPDINVYVEVVHRLSNLGAVVTQAAHGTSQQGFRAEWREIGIFTFDGDLLSRYELFDDADLATALARFEQLSPPTRRLENAATRVCERIRACFAAREWDALAETLADDVSTDDRRRVVGEGIRLGRDAVIAEISALAELGVRNATSEFIATRGSNLVLRRFCTSGRNQRPEQFHVEVLDVIEITADERITARVVFDPDDFDAAIAELDARYLAGEAADHAHTWSVITRTYTAINRHELPELTPDHVDVDHRRIPMIEAGEGTANVRAGWEFTPDLTLRIEAVHRLSNLGAVVTRVSHGTSQGGLDVEWRAIDILTVGGNLISRGEIFDEADLEAALAKFEQLSRPGPQLENAASQVAERFSMHFAARDWEAVAETLANDISTDDRRRVVGAGLRQGRDAVSAELSAVTEIGVGSATSDNIATRGEHLVLSRARTWGHDRRPEAFLTEMLSIVEINADEQIVAIVTFDPDDFEAAMAELDARYLAGEGAAHAHTWSVITRGHAVLNRRELPPTTTDLVSIDHRRGPAFAPGEGIQYLQAGIDLGQDIRTYVEVVHRLSDLGAVCTHVGHGISREGFDAEWRGIDLLTVTGDSVNRCEVFDEADLDAALAKFEQLSRPAPQLENVASQVAQRFMVSFAADDWDGMAEMLADNFSSDDRRRVVGAGVRDGQDAWMVDMRATADLWPTDATLTAIATRGRRLVLLRTRFSDRDPGDKSYLTELLGIVEINADERIVGIVSFDLDDFEAAIAELDGRYIAGEGAAHANTWSVIAGARAALIRHELPPTTPDWVNLDHRRGIAFPPGDFTAYVRVGWDQQQDMSTYIDAVHQLNDLGAVFTQVAKETSQDGFDAEWRIVELMTVEGGLISRAEFFDEADLDAALAKFEQLSRPAPQLENAAGQAYKRMQRCFAARDWDTMDEVLAGAVFHDDRRRMVGAGLREGRDAVKAELSALAEIGVKRITSEPVATRGRNLILNRSRATGRDQRADAFRTDVVNIVEIDAEGKIAALITFDFDDFDAAIEELETRYIAGEAADCSRTWSVVAGACAALTRRQLFPTTPDWVNIDHRRGIAFTPGELTAFISSAWNLLSDGGVYVETAHRLTNLGAVVSWAGHGTSQAGSEVEFRGINVVTVKDDLISRCEIFDDADLDAALATFEQLSRPARMPTNTASQVGARYREHFAAGDWDAMAATIADDFFGDDRRRVVGSGVRIGREAQLADMRAIADLFIANMTWTDIATRGDRLVLFRVGFLDRDQKPDAFHTEVLCVAEIDTDERIVTSISFDLDDVDAAFEELDARYLAGEAAAHPHTWSVIAATYAAFNRHELARTDWIVSDHRRGALFASSNMTVSVRAFWDQTPDLCIRIEAVHRVSDLGAVVTHKADGTSPEGFAAEWRMIQVLTVEGDQVDRCEIFDEADLDAALARFEELHPQTPRLENAATRVYERFFRYFAARDWDAMAKTFADDSCTDDRRRVVNAGVRRGRDVEVADMRALAELGIDDITSTGIATRGERLALSRVSSAEFQTEVLNIVEIDTENRIAAVVGFDLDDIDAAFEELDARYGAGEAAPYAQTWSVITGTYAAINRREAGPTAPDWVFVDHLPLQRIEAADVAATIRAMWDLTPDIGFHIEAVHRLTNVGGVVTRIARGTSQEGFDAEWRQVDILTVEGDKVNRCEAFGEVDVDAALARFEQLQLQLQPQAPRPQNAASQLIERFQTCFAARDWAEMAKLLADDISTDDRRPVVSAGSQRGRDLDVANMRALANIGVTNMTSTVIATRGQRLALSRARMSGRDQRPEAFHTEVLDVVEINADNRIAAHIAFDPDDIDAAFAELDARYLVGEAADHAHTWSVIAATYATFNRHELPATDWRTIDHRSLVWADTSDMPALIRSVWDLTPDLSVKIEAVHRLSKFGAVVAITAHGTSSDGVDAEWGMIQLPIVEGDRLGGCEVFDDADLDAAIARFEELHRPAPRLENGASRVHDRLAAYYAARDWDAATKTLADDFCSDDRRHVVNVGLRHGRDVAIANMQKSADLAITFGKSDVIATRGDRLALSRTRWSGPDQRPEAFHTEVLHVAEINADERVAARVMFDANDIDAAFAELDARYLAGEAADHAHTWSVITQSCAAFNRHELPATTRDSIYIDHRPGVTVEAVDLDDLTRATWDVTPNASIYIEAVHRLSDLGAVVTYTAHGSSRDGFAAEWRMVDMFMVDGDLISRNELFDEADLDAALARFEELQSQAPRLENAASQVIERFGAYFAARNWAAIAEISADEIITDDRRSVVSSGILRGRDLDIANIRATADLGAAHLTTKVIATRGERLALVRAHVSGRDQRPEAFHSELLNIVQIDAANRVTARILFDLNDIDAAFEELDRRYLADEAAAHAHTWSVISQLYAGFNRHELPATTPEFAYVDHRPVITIDANDLPASIRAVWDLTPDISIYMEAVHRLNDLGAVVTHTARGVSHEDFDAEWRMIDIFTVDGDLISRCEMFDEPDLDAALARFEELQPQAQRLENAASHLTERFLTHFAAHEWNAMAEILADDVAADDRRRVVGAGPQHGRDAAIADMRAIGDLGRTNVSMTVIATRGERLALSRMRFSFPDQGPDAFLTDTLSIAEANSDHRVSAQISFEVDEIDAAFAELDARYFAGEAAAHAHTWSVIARTCAAFNRHELPAADWVIIDHRRLAPIGTSDLQAAIHAIWDVTPDLSTRIEAVHRLSSFGAVVTQTARGISREGFDAEWRMIDVYTVEGDLISRLEMFDETDLDAALARFDQLSLNAGPAPSGDS